MLENYVVLDLEMTGLNPKTDKIMEIGAARIRDGAVTDTFQTFVDPRQKIPAKAAEITKITDDMLCGAPTAGEAIKGLIDFCGADFLVGHNIMFDYSFLKQAAVNEKLSFEKRGIDTLKLARKLLPELEHKTLEYLCSHYKIVREAEHRALFDALATGELLEHLKREFLESEEAAFSPHELQYRAKRQTPATKPQKIHLKELADYHKISLDVSFDTMTRNEASRLTDQIISRYGRIKL